MTLTPLQISMLEATEFHVDGWTSVQGKEAAAELEGQGLVESLVSQGEQYTAINYWITEQGIGYLRSRP